VAPTFFCKFLMFWYAPFDNFDPIIKASASSLDTSVGRGVALNFKADWYFEARVGDFVVTSFTTFAAWGAPEERRLISVAKANSAVLYVARNSLVLLLFVRSLELANSVQGRPIVADAVEGSVVEAFYKIYI
jgi:hypothetical protein